MIAFFWPLSFLLMILPWFVYQWLPEKKADARHYLKAPFLKDFECFKEKQFLAKSSFKKAFALFAFFTLVTAAARPQWIGAPVPISANGRDLMLAIDLSESMLTRDFVLNGKLVGRLNALKKIAADFIDQRKGDRLGLILFGTNAYVQTPLTFDGTTVKQFLMEAEVGLAGGQTAIGDAIGLGIKQLKMSPEKSRVLILLTDGNSNTGELSNERAASIAANEKIKIYTVAIGSKNQTSNFIGSEIDEKALQEIAKKTNGQYFRAYNTSELAAIYQKINELETKESEGNHYLPVVEMYQWPLLMTLISFGILLLL
ncbi:MAG TPA: VWA domain-containing protein [Parachlamydiaceae bacterium]|nr:VWA domain-containing protein [Parachlamydiaceae bacterium]